MRKSIIVIALTIGAATTRAEWPTLEGPYLGQPPPGMTPETFAPGLISLDGERELNSVFSPNGRIFMFSRLIGDSFKMFFSRQRADGTWQEPRMAAPSKTYPGHADVDMAFSPDGGWLYFISTRPLPGYSLERHNIWRSKVTRQGLLAPEPLGDHINGADNELYPWLVADGSLYFAATRADSLGGRDNYRAQHLDGGFESPANLGPGVNSEAAEGDIYVSPDESYLIHVASGRPDGLGDSDLYISFKQPDGSWGDDVHMGNTINSPDRDYCPVVTPDGAYFFFTRGDDIVWVDAAVLERFRR
ncbi:MAG: hypothetical protein AAF515_16285 [Pseudomonadota bacterium]